MNVDFVNHITSSLTLLLIDFVIFIAKITQGKLQLHIFIFKMFKKCLLRDIFLFQEAILATIAMLLNCPLETGGISLESGSNHHTHALKPTWK